MTRPNLLATINRISEPLPVAGAFDCGPWHDRGNAAKAHPSGSCIYCTCVRLAKTNRLRRHA